MSTVSSDSKSAILMPREAIRELRTRYMEKSTLYILFNTGTLSFKESGTDKQAGAVQANNGTFRT